MFLLRKSNNIHTILSSQIRTYAMEIKEVNQMHLARKLKYLEKNNFLPKTNDGSKGYGREGHILTGCNLLAKGGADPVIQKATEYPQEWFDVLEQPSVEELFSKFASVGRKNMTPFEYKKYLKYKRRMAIKDRNESRSKK